MDQPYSKTVILACAAVALFIFITGAFVLFKNNQKALNDTNAQTFAQLQAELNESVGSTVKGSYLKTFMNSNVSSTTVEIYVNGTEWNGTVAGITSLNINDSDDYTQDSPTVSGGKTIYKFNKKS